MLNDSTRRFLQFKEKASRELVFGLALMSAETALAEIVGLAGYEFAWIDMEHTALSLRDVEKLIIVCENTGCVPLVRVRRNEPNCIGQVLDMGARIVNIPHVDTVDDALEAVKGAKYYPLGRRGFASVSRSTGQGLMKNDMEYMQKKNNETMLMVQIESEEAVQNAADIARVEGVEILFVGYADLCQDMGITTDAHHPRCKEAIITVGEAVKQAGKLGMFITSNPNEVSYYRGLGYNLICCGVDIKIYMQAAWVLLDTIRQGDIS